MTKEIKAFRFEFEAKEDGDAMTITGYGSTFGGDPDCYGDIVSKGAFKKSLKARMPKMLYQHDPRRIAGVWEEASEDDKGLFLKGRFIPTTLGRDAYIEAKEGAIDSMSIGFSTVKYSIDEKKGIRTLEEVHLFEVSLVTYPANGKALITDVKSMPTTIREYEEFLREAGWNREDATTLALRGFKALDAKREAEDLTPLYEQMKNLTNSYKGISHA